MIICKKIIPAILVFSAVFMAFGQNGQGSVSMPSMPSISTPAMGNGFYVPGSAGFYQGQKNVPAKTPKSKDGENSGSEVNAAVENGLNSLSSSASGENSNNSSAVNAITASEISNLDTLGMLGNFSGILRGSTGNLLAGYGNSTTVSPLKSTDTALLQKILFELEELKKKVNGNDNTNGVAGITEKNTLIPASQSFDNSNKERNPAILRFIVNGSDILSSCRTVYFSKPESDGTFLLTGDRKYFYNGKNRTETFHLLFHANGIKDGSTTYAVTTAISQDWENKASDVYKLCQEKTLSAAKTGNLVTLRNSVKECSVDILIGLN